MKKIERVHTTTNGTKIYLKKIIAIGEINKDVNNIIYFNVYVHGMNKPIKFIAGHAVGIANETLKKNVENTYNSLVNAWETYILLTNP